MHENVFANTHEFYRFLHLDEPNFPVSEIFCNLSVVYEAGSEFQGLLKM